MTTMPSFKRRSVGAFLTALALLMVAPARLAAQTAYTWITDGNGSWSNAANWSPSTGYPNASGDSALFTTAITASRTITIDSKTTNTIGALIFSNAAPNLNWTITGGTLKLAVASGVAAIASTGGTNTIAAAMANTAPLNVAVTNGQLVFSGQVDGGKALTNNAGELVLSANWKNMYFTPVTINSGALLRVTNNCSFQANPIITVNAGGSLVATYSIPNWIGGISGAGSIDLTSTSTVALIMNQNGAFSGPISGNSGLRQYGATLTLSGTNTYGGATVIEATGRIKVQGGAAIADTCPIVFGAFYKLNDHTHDATLSSVFEVANSETVGSIASAYGTGAVQIDSGATLLTGYDNTSTLFLGIVTNAGNLVKIGTGAFTLNGTNYYTGTTIVSNGTLLVNGVSTNGGNYTVAAGATLGGTGLIDPAASKTVTVDQGATLAPGGTNGTLTIGVAAGPNNLLLNGALLANGDATRDPATPWVNINGDLVLGANSSVSGTNLDKLTPSRDYVLATYSGARSQKLANTQVNARWMVRYDDANKRLLLVTPKGTMLLLR